MKSSKILFVIGAFAALFASQAFAAPTTVQGKIVVTQGHEAPACRTVTLKRNDNGALMYFRIPDTGADNSILSITITALTAHLNVDVTYDPAITTGCGPEPKITFISLIANP